MQRVVIVGAGFGGLKAAKKLKRAPVQVTVIDRSNHHLFQPLLYQVATAGLGATDIAAPIRSVVSHQKNTEVLMDEVTGVDVAGRHVVTRQRSIPYDYLILATGARHSYFGHDEWENFAPGLKSIADARRIREKILLSFESAEVESEERVRRALLNFVIVGGGPTGVELAGSIAELAHVALASDFRHINPQATRVILVEAGPRILAGFPDDLAAKASRALANLGVEVRVNARVESISAEGAVISGQLLEARTVIWAAGVKASPAGQWLKAEVDQAGRVKVGADLTVPGHPEIFVIGDTASVLGEGGKPLPGQAPVALQQGTYVASVIATRAKGSKTPPPPFHYLDKGNLATIGRSSAIAEMGRIHLSGFLAWCAWLLVHIYYLIGFRNRVVVMIEWAWAYFTFQRGARLITRNRP
jgi:NADH dehydrogenase